MLDNIITFSIKNKFVIGLFTLALVLWGIYSLSRLPIDALPDITNNQVHFFIHKLIDIPAKFVHWQNRNIILYIKFSALIFLETKN